MIRALLALLSAVLFLIIGLIPLGIEFFLGKINPVKSELRQLHMVQWIFKVITFFTTTKIVVEGLDNIPEDKPVLYIGNHNSIFDVVCAYPLLKGRVGFIAKDNLLKVPLLPMWMRRIHCLFLNRSDAREGMKMMLTAADYIKEGVSIFIFPEGTRSKTGEMGEFKAGSFKIATKTNCDIIPVAITGTAKILKGHIPFVKSSTVTIKFLPAIKTEGMSREEQKELPEKVKEIIKSNLN